MINGLLEESTRNLVSAIELAIVSHRVALGSETDILRADVTSLETTNKDLLDKHKANTTLDELVNRQKVQQNALDRIEKIESRRGEVQRGQAFAASRSKNTSQFVLRRLRGEDSVH